MYQRSKTLASPFWQRRVMSASALSRWHPLRIELHVDQHRAVTVVQRVQSRVELVQVAGRKATPAEGSGNRSEIGPGEGRDLRIHALAAQLNMLCAVCAVIEHHADEVDPVADGRRELGQAAEHEAAVAADEQD